MITRIRKRTTPFAFTMIVHTFYSSLLVVVVVVAVSLVVPTVTGFVGPIQQHASTSQYSPSSITTTRTTGLNAVLFDVGAVLDINNLMSLQRNAAGTISSFYQNEPYLSAFVTCSVKASAADLVAQQQQDAPAAGSNQSQDDNDDTMAFMTTRNEQDMDNGMQKKNHFLQSFSLSTSTSSTDVATPSTSEEQTVDFRRTLAFWLYGGLYQGICQEFFYNDLFPSVFGDSHTVTTVIQQVMIDMMFLTPCVCLPVAYLVKAFVASDHDLPEGLQRYVDHVQSQGLLYKYWSLWAPVQTLTFGVIPTHFRTAFVAFVSFFWLMILSNISARTDDTDNENSGAVGSSN